VAVLRKGLASDHPGEISYCLNMLEELNHSTLETALLRLLNHRAPEVRRDALLRLERLGGRSGLERVRARLAVETEPQVRGTAIRALTALGEHEDLERALVGMDDPEPEVRLGAMVGLLRNGGIEGVLNAGERFVELSRSSQADERAFVARLIGEVGIASFYRPLLGLLADDDVEVRRVAVSAAGRLKNPRLWPQVLASLRDPKVRSAAMGALVAGGETVVELLESIYESFEQARDRPAQRRIVRLCCQIGGQRAVSLLWRKADIADGEVRHSILSGLVLLGYEADRQERNQVHARLEREVEQAVAVLAAIEDLGGDSADPLVIGTLEHALDRSRERVFCLLSFVHSSDSILKARVNLGSRSPEKRAQAVELIDSLLSQEEAELVVPLIEDVPHAARLGRLLGRFPQERFDAATRLRRLVDGGRLASPWMRAAAIHVAVTSGRTEMMDVVAWAATSSEGLVREAAAWGLARLAPGEVKLSPEVEALVSRFVGELSGRKEGVAPMLSTVEKVIILKSVSIFSETPDEILAEVASLLQEIEVAAGEPVFEKGDMGSAMYIVVEGRVRVHSEERMLRELGPRDIFGEMAALDPEPRSASVTALVPTHLFRLEQEALYELMADRIEVVRGVIRVLCQRLRESP
jgi:AAA family ATP:ADP antiporter